MGRYETLEERRRASKLRKELEKRELQSDIKKKAEACRKFIADKRHSAYKELLESAIAFKRTILEGLGDSVQDNDEMLRKAIVLSTEIKIIKWILNTPNKFIEAEERMAKQND